MTDFLEEIVTRRTLATTFAVMSLVALGRPEAQQSPYQTDPGVAEALDFYSAGDYRAALSQLRNGRIFCSVFIERANAWIEAAPPAERAHRQTIAAALGVEDSWTNVQMFDTRLGDWDRAAVKSDPLGAPLFFPKSIGGLVPWAMDLMSKSSPSAAVQAAWWPAAVGLLQQGSYWTRVAAEVPRARQHAPGARWRMVETIARVADSVPAPRPEGRRDEVLFAEPVGAAALKHAAEAIRWLDALRDDPSLAAEADLRAGYLEMRRRRWKDALDRFARARAATSDNFILAAASYFEGWSQEQQHQAPSAIESYRRALGAAPRMRTVATLLAAQLYMTGARDESYTILESALDADDPPVDLLLVLERGDARLLPRYLNDLHGALR